MRRTVKKMGPPKVVMVVTNFVTGDSRVQKMARWVARAGWDVTLVGRSKTDRQERFALGLARVIRVPVRPINSSAGGDWRRRVLLADYEGFELLLDELRPDLIHAHDIDTLGIAIRAKLRAQQEGREVKVVYDAHEYVAGLTYIRTSWRLAMLADEYEYISLADAVMTVTSQLAQALRVRYGLRELPVVVKNAPERRAQDVETDVELSDIRTDCGLPSTAELIVYSGWVIRERGLATVVAAMPQLPGVHFAVQASDRRRCADLEEQAKALDVGDRLHIIPYVAVHQVVDYLRTATVGVIPSLRTEDDEVVFTTKYFEYMHAHLPIVVSDVKPHAEMTRELGNGEVFIAGDVDSFALATRAVLNDRDRYVTAYDAPGLLETNSWEAQVPVIRELYTKVTGMAPSRVHKLRVALASWAPGDITDLEGRAAPSMSGARGAASSRSDLPASAAYWEQRYRSGGTSGRGSYSPYAELTAEIINRIFREREVEDLIEYGCGDGNQLSHLRVAKYVGLDAAPTAIERCAERFRDDPTKSFFLYNPKQHVDTHGEFSADCALSKEVIFHLAEDDVFETYMRHLFASARRLVVIVASDLDWYLGPYNRHRRFTLWVEANLPEWQLVEKIDSPVPYNFDTREGMLSDVYVFERRGVA
jgi:glycosyltransferase involved in cell wall biosynthesis